MEHIWMWVLQKEFALRRRISISQSIRWLSQYRTCKWSSSCSLSNPRSMLGRHLLGCIITGFSPTKGLSSWELTLTFLLMLFLLPWRSLPSLSVVLLVAHLVTAQGDFTIFLPHYLNELWWWLSLWFLVGISEDPALKEQTVPDMVTVMGTVQVLVVVKAKRVELQLITSHLSK